MSKPKTRLVPYRILAQLLYAAPNSYLEPVESGVMVRPGYAARANWLSRTEYLVALKYLEDFKFIIVHSIPNKRGWIHVSLVKPFTNCVLNA